ncbi:hypothetical protein [Pseudomonas sp. R45(2017)]|uniref:hypothetical protein n=1 Tax=Pseudomonas sp. R45(2017) TaxID=1981678 RepID=UPI000A1F3CFB|nr:hypothetical protein [Pseudomonas sp. R45(2017)]
MKLKTRIKAMLPTIWQYQFDLRTCRKAEDELDKTRPPNTQAAHDSGALYSYYCDSTELYQWRRSLVTKIYRYRLEKLGVPMVDPHDEKLWESVESGLTQDSVRCLTTAGEYAAIAAIREAQKHRREIKAFWLTWITGLGGIIIGVVSVLAKK